MSAKKTRRKDESKQSEEESPLPRHEIERFFHGISERAWTDAEKELDSIRQKSNGADWSRGYVKALEGILLSFRSGDDKYIFLPKVLQTASSENLETLRKEFSDFSQSATHGPYDRGFFKALQDFLSQGPTSDSQLALVEPPPSTTPASTTQDQDEE